MRFRDLIDFVLIGCCVAGTLIVLACLIAGCRTDTNLLLDSRGRDIRGHPMTGFKAVSNLSERLSQEDDPSDLESSAIAPEGRTPKNQTAGSPKPALIVRPSSIL